MTQTCGILLEIRAASSSKAEGQRTRHRNIYLNAMTLHAGCVRALSYCEVTARAVVATRQREDFFFRGISCVTGVAR